MHVSHPILVRAYGLLLLHKKLASLAGTLEQFVIVAMLYEHLNFVR